MALVEIAPSDDIRAILCLKFDRRAPSDAVSRFKHDLANCASVVHSVELSGAFDVMVEAALPDFVAYHALLDQFAVELATLVERHEASFVCRRFLRTDDDDRAIWVPCREGRRRIACSSIDRISAEGDYVRLHCGAQSWLLHDRMHHMREMLDPQQFLTVHRSTIVNIAFIEQLVHHGHYWVLLLADGQEQRIAKSQVATVLAALRTDSSSVQRLPPMRRHLAESRRHSAENAMRSAGNAAMVRS